MSSRRLLEQRVCPECTAVYRPTHRQQQTCSRSCGAVRRARTKPHTAAMQRAWLATQAKARQVRHERLRTLTRTQIWHTAYQAGYGAGYRRGVLTGQRRRTA